MAKTKQPKSRSVKLRKPKPKKTPYAGDSYLFSELANSIRGYSIFRLDAHGNILTWSKTAERLTGYKFEEVNGRSFSVFYTPEDMRRKHPEAELKEAKKTGRYEEEGWRVKKDGSQFWSHIVITKLTDKKGHLTGFLVIVRDLTFHRNMERKVQESENRFRLLVEGVKDCAIFMLDPSGKVASWNEGAARIKGYQIKEIVGRHFSIFYTEEDIRDGKCERELRVARELGHYEEEGWRLRKDGSRFWANVLITAIYDEKKRLLGFAKVTRDLSERKRSEDRLRAAYADLERRVRERTDELARTNRELELRQSELREAVRVREEFLSIASHELKTPITSLKMQMQMLQHRTNPELGLFPSPERLSKALSTSIRQVDRLTKLVEDLLDVARAHARKVTFELEPSDLRVLVAEVIERLSDQLEVAGCQVIFEAGEPVPGEFDRFRIDQVLVNLLTNAMKYAPGSKIYVSVRPKNGNAILTVKDEGAGIPRESQARLFERFERGPNAQNINGLGLGLYISKQIVEGHRGSIAVKSDLGRGTSFIVTLPLAEESGDRAPE